MSVPADSWYGNYGSTSEYLTDSAPIDDDNEDKDMSTTQAKPAHTLKLVIQSAPEYLAPDTPAGAEDAWISSATTPLCMLLSVEHASGRDFDVRRWTVEECAAWAEAVVTGLGGAVRRARVDGRELLELGERDWLDDEFGLNARKVRRVQRELHAQQMLGKVARATASYFASLPGQMDEEPIPVVQYAQLSQLMKIGEGNFGEVWRALLAMGDVRRDVVIKKPKKPEVADDEEELRLRRADATETLCLAQLSKAGGHENVVTFVGACADVPGASGPCQVLTYHGNGSLLDYMMGNSDELVEQWEQDPWSLLRFVRGMSAGVGFLHQNGLVHGDLKTDNFLVTRAGQPRVSDLGLSRHVHGKWPPGTLLPLRRFPPEFWLHKQCFHEPGDVWMLGLAVMDLLRREPMDVRDPKCELPRQLDAGATVLQVPIVDTVQAVASGPAARALVSFLRKCLALSPADRFRSAQACVEFLDQQLSASASGAPIIPREPSAPSAAKPAGTNDPACSHCGEPITSSQFVRVGKYKFHTDHFVCTECGVSLHGSKFHHKRGKFYCTEDYGKLFTKKCHSCKEPIASGSMVQALGRAYHPQHFVCFTCEQPFEAGKYYEFEGEPYCDEHFAEVSRVVCAGCGEVVEDEAERCVVGSSVFHAQCMKCAHCDLLLDSDGGDHIFSKDGSIYCQGDYVRLFGRLCGGCAGPILKQCVSVNDESYHADCLRCAVCSTELASYISVGGDLRCPEHADVAAVPGRCDGCSEPIEEDQDVTKLAGKRVHRACASCSTCSRHLNGSSARLNGELLSCTPCLLACKA